MEVVGVSPYGCCRSWWAVVIVRNGSIPGNRQQYQSVCFNWIYDLAGLSTHQRTAGATYCSAAVIVIRFWMLLENVRRDARPLIVAGAGRGR